MTKNENRELQLNTGGPKNIDRFQKQKLVFRKLITYQEKQSA